MNPQASKKKQRKNNFNTYLLTIIICVTDDQLKSNFLSLQKNQKSINGGGQA